METTPKVPVYVKALKYSPYAIVGAAVLGLTLAGQSVVNLVKGGDPAVSASGEHAVAHFKIQSVSQSTDGSKKYLNSMPSFKDKGNIYVIYPASLQVDTTNAVGKTVYTTVPQSLYQNKYPQHYCTTAEQFWIK